MTQVLLLSGSLSWQYCGILSWHIIEKSLLVYKNGFHKYDPTLPRQATWKVIDLYVLFRDAVQLFKKMKGKTEPHSSKNDMCRQVLREIVLRLPTLAASSLTMPQEGDETFHINFHHCLVDLDLKRNNFLLE